MSGLRNFNAIQFVGTQRSGSNLLRVMLNQLPEISAPHPPHILKTFFPLLQYYGDLDAPNNFYKLVADVCDWVNSNPVPWDGVNFQPDEVMDSCTEQTLVEIFKRIYEKKAQIDHASIWCCKSMENIHYTKQIENGDIRPFYIHIYRDGRDVALSFLKAIVGPKHVYHLAKKWVEEQSLALELRRTVSIDRWISIRYEDLICEPKVILKSVCEALNVCYKEEIWNYNRSKETIITASSGAMWENLTKPILKNNHHKFLTELPVEEIQLFEFIANNMLTELGYEIYTEFQKLNIGQDKIDEFEKLNAMGIQNALKMADPQDIIKRSIQSSIIKRITMYPVNKLDRAL